MRYAKDENTYILATFNSGDTVTIDIYKLSDNSLVVDDGSCSEVGSTGVFKYSFSQTITQKEEYLWIMTNGSYSKYGKIVLSGYMDEMRDNLNNPDQYKADVSSLAIESNIEQHVTNSLNNYDPPTRTELANDRDSIINEINNNESKIDLIKVKTDTINWSDIEFLKSVEGGRWKIDDNTNQMIFYKEDNVTELMRFSLYDRNGSPASKNVYERRRV